MSRMRLGFSVSLGLHAALLAALVLLASRIPPPLAVLPHKSFQIALNPPAARLEPVPPVAVEPQTVTPVPPTPEKPVVTREIPPQPQVPAVTAVVPPPPPPLKPVVRRPPRPVVRRPPPQIAERPPAPEAPPAPPQTAYAPIPAPQPAPAPPPNPALAAGYRAALSRWFEEHKRYPETARDRGEEGSAIVRFRVDRSGRVLDFSLVRSTGYPDLDKGIADMLRGAQMPAFPPGLEMSSLDIAVTLRFSLTQ